MIDEMEEFAKWRDGQPACLDRPCRTEDEWFYETPLTTEELAEVRAWKIRNPFLDGPDLHWTCDACGDDARKSCALAYDGYNTNGDCLAEK